jgi:hypothetical protein
MNKFRILFTGCLLIFLTTSAYSIGGNWKKSEHFFGVTGGANISSGHINKDADMGFNIGFFGVMMQKEHFAFHFFGTYNQSGNKRQTFPSLASVDYEQRKFGDLSFGTGVRLHLMKGSLTESINPYVGIDAGYLLGIETLETKYNYRDDLEKQQLFHSNIFFIPNVGITVPLNKTIHIDLNVSRQVGLGFDLSEYYDDDYDGYYEDDTPMFHLDLYGYYKFNLGIGVKL